MTAPSTAAPTAMTATPGSPAFSLRLREATRNEHSDAENTSFIAALMAGERTEVDYWRLLGQYLPLYEVLETRIAAAVSASPLAASFHDGRLHRTQAIRADLRARWGSEAPVVDGVDLTSPLPGTAAYIARIRDVAAPGLIAHHYLRYLGDLSGGQAIGALVARHYAVPRAQLSMWDFSSIDAPKRVKDAYRARLDAITDEGVAESILAEARTGYMLAGALFADLER